MTRAHETRGETMTMSVAFPLSVSLHTLDPAQRPETVDLLAGSPVRAVELWAPTFEKGEGAVAEMRRRLAAAGVAPRTVHAAFGAELDLSSPDPAVRDAGIAAVGAALALAQGVGAEIVVVHPSSEPIADDARGARMDLAKGSVRTIAAMAERAGERIALEWLPRTCLGHSVDELLALVAVAEGDTVGVCLDTNHLMGDFAALPEAVRTFGPRLIALHCSDYDGVDEKHWPPGRGVIDWGAFMAALRDVGFPGPFHYEAGLDGETPAEKLAFLEGNYARLVAGGGG
ncbi:MAG: sugar phosphate isomerase/epimerase [Anaerolineae bacterium]|nr:sugar phosphate isomerase/epimerase [Anaerolineae bacterium]